MPASRVSVIVADDHPVFREGLAQAVRSHPELQLVAEAADGRAALAAIREHRPQVAVLDLRMPGLGGIDVLQTVVREDLPTGVVALSAGTDLDLVARAIALGAGAYLPKSADRRDILDAVTAVARGDVVLPEAVRDRRRPEDRPALTPREQQVLALTAQGHSAPDVAKALHVSTATVKTHQGSLYAKLGVSDRAAAVAAAMRAGLLE